MRILLFLLLASYVSATVFQDCGSLGSDVTFIVEGCEVPPCLLHRGTIIPTIIEFIPSVNSDTLTNAITGNLGGIEVPWPGMDPDACHFTTCPITAGTKTHWEMPVEILAEYPEISTVVTFKLLDNSGASQSCILMPVTLV
ncbi:hypothetical protein Pmani_015073 [Petrolisthes manimaculis]|uniref:MD-2-related lipid-recognition domain-containing protein n=1 Tax=Petrolisthes manimaculis TaxID=1843537 RepID=A0AAE1UCE1_9EUCA|nr:hypothetical protein Pmani_015073 [Petrolisthes manimaculis]